METIKLSKTSKRIIATALWQSLNGYNVSIASAKKVFKSDLNVQRKHVYYLLEEKKQVTKLLKKFEPQFKESKIVKKFLSTPTEKLLNKEYKS